MLSRSVFLPIALFGAVCCPVPSAGAGEIKVWTDQVSGTQVYQLSQGTTIVRVAPEAGANAYSIRVDGHEYLRQPETLEKLPGAGYGNPVLYPTPNRVKNAKFRFRGKTFRFPANAGKNFIHGLVNRQSWRVVSQATDEDSAGITCAIEFREDSAMFQYFPLPHTLRLSIEVSDRQVRWEYEVDNTSGESAVPFGFALHPYFMYQGKRDKTFLTIPATHWMESAQMLPSGKLVPAGELDYPLGEPMLLQDTTFDDVYYGMRTERPTLIEFRDTGDSIQIVASPEFTHLVVWTPQRPYFGIESQTCSTDAHNLDDQGDQQAAHLQVCEPGNRSSGWVEYRFNANDAAR